MLLLRELRQYIIFGIIATENGIWELSTTAAVYSDVHFICRLYYFVIYYYKHVFYVDEIVMKHTSSDNWKLFVFVLLLKTNTWRIPTLFSSPLHKIWRSKHIFLIYAFTLLVPNKDFVLTNNKDLLYAVRNFKRIAHAKYECFWKFLWLIWKQTALHAHRTFIVSRKKRAKSGTF